MLYDRFRYIVKVFLRKLSVIILLEVLWQTLVHRYDDSLLPHLPVILIGAWCFIYSLSAFFSPSSMFSRYEQLVDKYDKLKEEHSDEYLRLVKRFRKWDRGIASLAISLTAFGYLMIMRFMNL
jgi:hypothetical protein